MLKASFIAIK